MGDPIDKRIAVVAGRQRGYVKREQLFKLGVGEGAIRYRVHIGRLIPDYAGVYAVGHRPTLPQDRAFGALLACGDDAVLSHSSAAAVWGIVKHWEMPFEVTVRGGVRRRAGIRVHRAKLARRDRTRQLGLPVTSVARTILDIAPRLTPKRLTRAVNNLRLSNQLQLEDLADVVARFPRHPGARSLRALLDIPAGPTRSEFEDVFKAFAERYRLPVPLLNVRVAGYEVDAFFPEERVIVELDGWLYHSGRDEFRSDRERDTHMLARAIETVRITWDRLIQTPDREAARLHAILRRRRAA